MEQALGCKGRQQLGFLRKQQVFERASSQIGIAAQGNFQSLEGDCSFRLAHTTCCRLGTRSSLCEFRTRTDRQYFHSLDDPSPTARLNWPSSERPWHRGRLRHGCKVFRSPPKPKTQRKHQLQRRCALRWHHCWVPREGVSLQRREGCCSLEESGFFGSRLRAQNHAACNLLNIRQHLSTLLGELLLPSSCTETPPLQLDVSGRCFCAAVGLFRCRRAVTFVVASM